VFDSFFEVFSVFFASDFEISRINSTGWIFFVRCHAHNARRYLFYALMNYRYM
jgi:hypothetical protein